MLDRKKFFDGIRSGPFPGSLSPETVRGVTAILDAWDRSGLTDLRWLAYMLATVLAECGRNMLPVREGFKTTDAAARAYVLAQGYKYAVVVNGHVYYGRGLVQLTWHENYVRMGKILGIDLANNPDLALDPVIASKIMFEGMTTSLSLKGDFTGHHLGEYFSGTKADWRNARQIINRMDRADEIAGYAKAFYVDLQAAEVPGVKAPAPAPMPSTKPPVAIPGPVKPKPPVLAPSPAKKGLAAVLVAALAAAAGWFADHWLAIAAVAGLSVGGWLFWRWRRKRAG